MEKISVTDTCKFFFVWITIQYFLALFDDMIHYSRYLSTTIAVVFLNASCTVSVNCTENSVKFNTIRKLQ